MDIFFIVIKYYCIRFYNLFIYLSGLPNVPIWMLIYEFTQGTSPIPAITVEKRFRKKEIWKSIEEFTQEKNRLCANYVVNINLVIKVY